MCLCFCGYSAVVHAQYSSPKRWRDPQCSSCSSCGKDIWCALLLARNTFPQMWGSWHLLHQARPKVHPGQHQFLAMANSWCPGRSVGTWQDCCSKSPEYFQPPANCISGISWARVNMLGGFLFCGLVHFLFEQNLQHIQAPMARSVACLCVMWKTTSSCWTWMLKNQSCFHWLNATSHTLTKVWCSSADREYGVTTSK